MSVYVSVNRNVLSRSRKAVRDGADVTSGGRQFHTWGQQPKMLCCQQWNDEPEVVRGSRCRKSEVIGDLEGQQQCTAVDDLAYQDGNLGLDS